jgi:peptide deformylase
VTDCPAILSDDDPLLREISKSVQPFHMVKDLVASMLRAAERHGGRGLAAVQIGIPLRVLIIREDDGWLAMVNPTLERTLNRFTTEREGCLSILPHKWGNVSRPAKCDATWLDLDGNKRSATLTGESARIFQHEFDHLNGVLMTDRMGA